MGIADLHIHTTYSWDGTCSVPTVLKRAAQVGLDVIAITDHDEIRGALEAVQLAPLYRLGVIPGSEISTADGHLLALFIQQPIPKGLSFEETLRRVADQGGCCIAAHPAARGTSSLSAEKITQAVRDPELARILVGIEVLNAGLFHQHSNHLAKKLADSLPVAQVGNSDAHTWMTVGNGSTIFAGTSVAELRQSLHSGKTLAVSQRTLSPMLIVSDWLSSFVIRKTTWLTGNARHEIPLGQRLNSAPENRL